MNLEEYRARFAAHGATPEGAPGREAIDARLAQVYPGIPPRHYATEVQFRRGGLDPLDGISVYRCGSGEDLHLHFVTYGLSALYYGEEALGGEYSGFGFELSFRLKPFAVDPEWPVWPLKVLQNLARHVFSSNQWFEAYQVIPAGGPIRLDTETEITGLAFVTDPVLGQIATPHGQVQFMQMLGVTTRELEAIGSGALTMQKLILPLISQDPLLVTDLARRGVAGRP